MLRLALAALLICATPISADTRIPQSQMEIKLGFAPLVKEAAPAVVNIYAKRVVQERQSPFRSDPFFREFFRDFGATRPRVQNSLGSGVILSADGYAVSNFHVVGNATDIRVVLKDRREFEAEVVLADADSDLAILRLKDAKDMPFLELRDSDSVEVGELVLAIGNPFGIGQTVTSGIVSGLARSGTATGNARGYFLQTDAAINPGNSGGALIDVNGKLLGINTSIFTKSGGSNGIGFAIPSRLVERFVAQARVGETTFQRPWAGISGQEVDTDIANSLGLDLPGGVLISDLHKASPFLAAGFAPGDVVIAVDDQPINTPPEMMFRMSLTELGDQVEVTALRAGETVTHAVEMIAPPERPARNTLELSGRTALPGLVVANVNPAVQDELGLSAQSEGVVVMHPGPYGARVGLQVGDIIKRINGDRIDNPSRVAELLSGRVSRLAFDVQRGLQRVMIRFRV